MEDVWRVYRRYTEGAWKVHEGCAEGVQKVCKRYAEGAAYPFWVVDILRTLKVHHCLSFVNIS